ncbi:MAG: PEP-CTERM system TPR-repeat protein PrsT, partial [Gammaproteobacteria bacterium]
AMLVGLLPRHREARYLLAKVQADLDQPQAVVETLSMIESEFQNNGPMLLVYGEALRAIGRARDAQRVLHKAMDLMPRSVATRVALARTELDREDPAAAIATLDGTSQDERTSSVATGGTLVTALVESGDLERARALAEELVREHPNDPAALTLLGALEFEQGEPDGARARFEAALAADPSFTAAALRLAQLDLQSGRLAEAATRYLGVLDRESVNLAALSGLARVAMAQGDTSGAIRWLEKARVSDVGALSEVLSLLQLYVATGRLDEAMTVASDLAAQHPETFAAQMAYARLLALKGQPDRARVVYRRCTRFAGYDIAMLRQLANAQLDLRDTDGARVTLSKARDAAPDDAGVVVDLIRLYVAEGRYEEALEVAETVAGTTEAPGLREFLRGEILTRLGRHGAAADAYAAAARRKPDAALVERIQRSRLAAGDSEGAVAILTDWLETHPDDTRIRHALAATYLYTGDLERAEPLLRELAAAHPDSAEVRNNLAWLLIERGNEEGLEEARAAHELAPQSADILDTYGWARVRFEDPEAGLALIREAVARAGATPSNQYHLAVALAKLGRDDEAREVLEALLVDFEAFPERNAAVTLGEELALESGAAR